VPGYKYGTTPSKLASMTDCSTALKVMATKNFIASSERAWKNRLIGCLMLYSISSSSEVIRKNVQNISC
jgi:hypothetical protein